MVCFFSFGVDSGGVLVQRRLILAESGLFLYYIKCIKQREFGAKALRTKGRELRNMSCRVIQFYLFVI